jgi:hypothetical protein
MIASGIALDSHAHYGDEPKVLRSGGSVLINIWIQPLSQPVLI